MYVPLADGAVIVSCGGLPYDINMIQAHKALDMAAHACVDGGTIIFLAECIDGPGRSDFMKWFDIRVEKLKWATDLHRFPQTAEGILMNLCFICVHLWRPALGNE